MLNSCGGVCMKKKSCFTGYLDVKAFTLIELLVVVLIIGILAAVAVGQYAQAVEKSRFATYRALANNLAQAIEAAYLANGSWPTSLDELSTELPTDLNTETTPRPFAVCRKNSKMFCCMAVPTSVSGEAASGAFSCGDNNYNLIYHRMYANTSGTPVNSMSCVAKGEKYKAVCKAISGGKEPSSSGLMTPDGWKYSYSYYSLK